MAQGKNGKGSSNGVIHGDAKCADPITPLPPMREPNATQPETPSSKFIRPPPPSDPPKLRGTRVGRTRQGLGVIWATLKVIWKVWTK